MKNIVTASIEFSFKGKRLTPSITLELDKHLQSSHCLPNFYLLIARENNFDLYSYEYEMMQAETIKFKNAQGLVANFITNEELNAEAFETAWHENNALSQLLAIAINHMNITDFEQHTELKQALLAAYELGKLDSQ